MKVGSMKCGMPHFSIHEILNKLKSKCFLAQSLSTYLISTLYTLPHNLIKDKVTEIVEKNTREDSVYMYLVLSIVITNVAHHLSLKYCPPYNTSKFFHFVGSLKTCPFQLLIYDCLFLF